ncbi:MAG: tetratricopeptide repeat protein, partial [Christensenellaceae bacterium]|nr:tetratricopeptide repeat protein [Christensenellaceae bacterium]
MTIRKQAKFTNREKPLEIFWNKYNNYKENMKTGKPDISVLMYYGFGGFGKSALIKQLKLEMEQKLQKPQYVYFDFKIKQESGNVLESIRNMLVINYEFEFPLFDFALLDYAKKIGDNIALSKNRELLKKSEFGNFLLKGMEMVSGVGIVVKLFKWLESGIELGEKKSKYMNFLEKNIKELNDIEIKEPAELYAYLPYLFAKDLTDNLKNNQEPLVVFLDSYEELVNEMLPIGEPLNNDVWIRGKNGLIQNTPNVLWVIAGREKLKWENFNSIWSKVLEQHKLDNLIKEDSIKFLQSAGIEEPVLHEGLFELTHGTPIYLELCVNIYCSLIEKDKKPQIEDFGKNIYDLVTCFVRHMDDSRKDIVYALSLLEIWDDEIVNTIRLKVLPNVSPRVYNIIKEFSFIAKNEELYLMHQTVREVLAKNYYEKHKETATQIIEEAITYCNEKRFDKDLYDEKRDQYLLWFVRFVMKVIVQSNIISFFKNDIEECFDHFLDIGKFETAEKLLNLIFPCVEEQSKAFAYLLFQSSKLNTSAGQYYKALENIEKSKKIYTNLNGIDDLEYLIIDERYGIVLSNVGRYEESLKIFEEVLSKRKEILGENHPDTIVAMNNLGVSYSNLGEYENAFKISKEVLSKNKEIQGENHPDTIVAMNNLGKACSDLGRYEESLKINEEVLSKFKEILGENHPYTIDTMNNLGKNYSDLGRYEESLETMKEVLSKYKEILGE